MLKSIAIAGALLLSASATAQQSLQSMHSRVPAPPATAAAAPGWLTSAEVTTLRKQLKDQRAYVEKLFADAAANQSAGLSNSGGIDFQRAQREPEYAKQVQAKIAAMSQAEQMALAMQMSQATQKAAVTDVVKMSRDPEAVKLAADHYGDYQTKQANGGITAQYNAVYDIQQKVSARALQISEKAGKAMKCSDGEGSCSKAEAAADKATLRTAHAQIIAEYDNALAAIGQQVDAARKARLADIAAVQKDMAATQYGAAAQSSANKQILATYHNTALIEVEQLFTLSEDAAKWAAARFKDRTINFMPID